MDAAYYWLSQIYESLHKRSAFLQKPGCEESLIKWCSMHDGCSCQGTIDGTLAAVNPRLTRSMTEIGRHRQRQRCFFTSDCPIGGGEAEKYRRIGIETPSLVPHLHGNISSGGEWFDIVSISSYQPSARTPFAQLKFQPFVEVVRARYPLLTLETMLDFTG